MATILKTNEKGYPFRSFNRQTATVDDLWNELQEVYRFLETKNKDLTKQVDEQLVDLTDRIAALESAED